MSDFLKQVPHDDKVFTQNSQSKKDSWLHAPLKPLFQKHFEGLQCARYCTSFKQTLVKFLQDHRQDSGDGGKQSLMGAGGARQDIVFTEEVLFWLGSESQRGTSKWEIRKVACGRGNGIDSSEEVGNSYV